MCPIDAPATPPTDEPARPLGRMQLTLRLAAGQAVEHAADLFRRRGAGPATGFDAQAMRFAYAMRDQLIVADARTLQAERHELENAPPERQDALRGNILRVDKPYRPEPPPRRSSPHERPGQAAPPAR